MGEEELPVSVRGCTKLLLHGCQPFIEIDGLWVRWSVGEGKPRKAIEAIAMVCRKSRENC